VSPALLTHQHQHTTWSVDSLVLSVGGNDCVDPPPYVWFRFSASQATEAVCVVCGPNLIVEN
jgi:hypothetical protein